MTSQANAYYANKLKERELNEVKVPEVQLKERSLEEVEKPKVAISASEAKERARSNLATESLKQQEIDESKRYHDMDISYKRDTNLTRDEQFQKEYLSAAKDIFKSGDLKNLYGSIGWEAYSNVFGGLADARRSSQSTNYGGLPGLGGSQTESINSRVRNVINKAIDNTALEPVVNTLHNEDFDFTYLSEIFPKMGKGDNERTTYNAIAQNGHTSTGGGKRF